MIEEQGESFHKDIKTIEKIPGMLNINMLADYCWGLERACWQ